MLSDIFEIGILKSIFEIKKKDKPICLYKLVLEDTPEYWLKFFLGQFPESAI